MSESGYIKLHRSLLNWEWYGNKNVLRLFIHLLLSANYEDAEWQGITIKRGQLVTSLSTLATETGESIKELRTSIAKLKSTHCIEYETASKYRIITVCNYDKYQSCEQTDLASKGQAEGKQEASKGQQLKKERNKEYIVVDVNIAHARDYLLSLGDFWRENVKREVNRIKGQIPTDEELNGYIEDYQSHLIVSGHKNVDNFQSHFANWLRIRLTSELNNKPKSYEEKLERLPNGFSIYD